MAFVAVFDGRNIPIDRYDQAAASGGPAVWQQPARSHHVCYRSGDGFVVVDVWESEEAFVRFGEDVIGPALAAAGIGPDELQPEIHPVHALHAAGDANVATVRSVYEAFGRGDIPAILDSLDDEVEWEAGGNDHGVPWLRPGRGKEHVKAFFQTLQAIEFKRFEPTAIIGNGDTVVALIELEAVVRDTGGTITDQEAHVWTFDGDSRVRSFRHIVDTAQHVRAIEP